MIRDDALKAWKKAMKSMGGQDLPGLFREGVGQFIPLTFAEVPPPPEGQELWQIWMDGPVREVFEGVRGEGGEYLPALFFGVKNENIVVVTTLNQVHKDFWFPIARKFVEYLGREKVAWVMHAGDTWIVSSDDPVVAKSAQLWVIEHGKLEGHPQAQECLMIHVEVQTSSGVKYCLIEHMYAVEGGQVNWIGDPHVADPVRDGKGRFAQAILT